MTLFQPQMRTTAYAPRSIDPTEATILTPGAGAPHSDQFLIATHDIGGSWKAGYMKLPTGRRGTFDPLKQDNAHGTLTIEIIDTKLAFGQEAQRWVSAYLDRLSGAKVKVEWRTDPAAAFADFWVGRCLKASLARIGAIALQIGDMSEDLEDRLNMRRPHPSATGLVTPLVLPVGVSGTYGPITSYNGKGPLVGTVKSSGKTRYIELDAKSGGRSDNVVTAKLAAKARIRSLILGLNFGRAQAARGLRIRASVSGGFSNKEFIPVKFEAIGKDHLSRVATIAFEAVPTSDPFYQAIDTGSIPDGTTVSFDVREDQEPETLVATTTIQHAKDVLDGYFGYLTEAGAVTRAVARNAASFAALAGTADDLVQRWRMPPGVRRAQWLNQVVLQPALMGYRFNGSGEAEVFSWARPTSVGSLVTLTDDDLADPFVRWSEDNEAGITNFSVTLYEEAAIDPQKITSQADGNFPDLPTGLLEEVPDEAIPLGDAWGSVDLKPRDVTIDAKGFRYMAGETLFGPSRADYYLAQVARLSELYSSMFGGRGPDPISFRCRRTTGPASLRAGMWCLIAFSAQANGDARTRGGTRLVFLTQTSEDGAAIQFDGYDAGPNVIANAPTLGAPAQEASNTKYGFTQAVTLNAASDPVTVWVNFTSTAVGSRPADSDAGWMAAFPLSNAGRGPDFRVRATGTETFRVNPPGKRVWVRARSEASAAGGSAKMASSWAYPGSGTGYVDLDPLPACTSVAISSPTAKAARVSWTPGDTALPVVVLLGSGASQVAADASTPVIISPVLPPGTTRYDLTGLDAAGPWYRTQVAHIDQWGNYGPVAGTTPTSFQATGASAVAPTPAALLLIRGGSTTGPLQSPGGGLAMVGQSGVELQLVPGPTGIGYDIRVYRAIETAVGSGTPGAYSHVHTVPAELVTSRGYPWRDFFGADGLKRYYKIRLIGPGSDESGDSVVVSDTAGWLPVLVNQTDAGEAVLGDDIPIVINGDDFRPQDSSEPFRYSNGGAETNAASSTATLTCPLKIPEGAVITSLELLGKTNAAGSSLALNIYEIDNADTVTGFGTLTLGNTSNVVTSGATSLSRAADGAKRYTLGLDLISGGGAGFSRLLKAIVRYRPNSYGQVRS